MRNTFTAVFIYLLFLNFQSQAALTKMWDYRIGGGSLDYPVKLYETLDRGYLICGYSNSGISFDKTANSILNDYWIVKTDSAGNVLWDKTFGGMSYDYFTCAAVLPDSGFLLGGTSRSNAGGEKSQDNHDSTLNTGDFWIIKIDKYGNKIWDKTFGGNSFDELESIVASTDGSFLLAGRTRSSLNGDMTHPSYFDFDYWAVKIDSAGIKLWDMNYGGGSLDYLTAAVAASDKGYILGGFSSSSASSSKSQNKINSSSDYWIVKIDSNGIQQWDKTIGGDEQDILWTINLLPNDYLLLGGVSYSGIGFDKSVSNHGANSSVSDFWIVKTDSMGNKISDKVYGGDAKEDELNNVSIINGGFLITGTSYSMISGDKSQDNIFNTEQSWVLAIDTQGNSIWDLTINNPTHSEFCFGFQTFDGCFVFLSQANIDGGDVSQNRFSDIDYWISKFCLNNSLPAADYTASSTAFCLNTCLDFSNLSSNAISYQWFFPGGTPSTSTQFDPQGICYDSSGTFDVTLVAFNSTGTDTLTLHQFLTVFPQVPFTPITQIGDTLFSIPGYVTYQWYTDSILIPGAINYYYVAQHSGDYSVIVTDSNGCFATAFKTNVIAAENKITSISKKFKIYAASNRIILESGYSSSVQTRIMISDMMGKVVYDRNTSIAKGRNEIFIDDLNAAQGIYLLSINNSFGRIYQKIFVN